MVIITIVKQAQEWKITGSICRERNSFDKETKQPGRFTELHMDYPTDLQLMVSWLVFDKKPGNHGKT